MGSRLRCAIGFPALMLALSAHAASPTYAGTWVATSTTSLSITGDLTVGDHMLTFAGDKALALGKGQHYDVQDQDLGALRVDAYAIVGPDMVPGLHGNTLKTPDDRFVLISQDDQGLWLFLCPNMAVGSPFRDCSGSYRYERPR